MCFADGDRARILRFILENTIVALFAYSSAYKFTVSRVRQQGRAAKIFVCCRFDFGPIVAVKRFPIKPSRKTKRVGNRKNAIPDLVKDLSEKQDS